LLLQRSEKKKDEKSSVVLEKMDRQINKLTMLIGDLLNLARIQTGRFEFRNEYFAIDDLLKETVESLQGTTEKHRIKIQGKTKKKVYADRDRVSQVLINLLTNAIKYSPKADRIIVHSKTDRNNVTIAVQDFGIGIPKRDLNKIFDRFFRVEGADEKTYPGFGIGLFVSAEIVARHGGKIWAESEKGKGSTFYFTLPLSSK
jgi:signal transduction histidine kinase